MRNKKSFLVISAVFSIFLLAGAAFAANTATINVTSEPIKAQATCDKAGGITITFDRNTVLRDNDQITMDLTLNVTLCRTIDLVVSHNGGSDLENDIDTEDIGWDETNSDIGGPVVLTDESGAATSAGGGVYFYVHGVSGTARVTIDVIGESPDATYTIGTGNNDKLAITILDQATNTDYGTDGVYVDSDDDGIYDEDAAAADNTICINVSSPAFTGSVVNGNFDSAGDKFTFIPSNPQIAHITPASAIDFSSCKGQDPGRIDIGDRITQGSDTCDAFDNETSSGYCSFRDNRLILAATSPFDLAQYQISLEILVNGAEGDNGVYWSSEEIGSDGYNTSDEACDAPVSEMGLGAATYLLANGSAASPDAPHSDDCDVDAIARAVTVTSPESDLGLVSPNDYLWIDMPAFNYDLDEINEGDVVSVRVTLFKTPCGTVFTGVFEVGTFGCISTTTDTIYFPYFTEMSDTADDYWDGIAITNLGGTTGSCDLTIYEQDGDVGAMTITGIAPRSMYVNLLSAMLPSMTLSSSGGSGTLGDSRCWIYITGDFSMDGFAMISRPDTGESMGYIPRLVLEGLVE